MVVYPNNRSKVFNFAQTNSKLQRIFEIDRRHFAIRLTAPYSDERRQAASELAKKNGLKGRV